MSYATLMVHLDLDQENDARLSVVGDLAERFTARVIGVAAQVEPVYYAADVDAAGFVAADLGQMEGWFLRKKTYIEPWKGVNSFWILDFGNEFVGGAHIAAERDVGGGLALPSIVIAANRKRVGQALRVRRRRGP